MLRVGLAAGGVGYIDPRHAVLGISMITDKHFRSGDHGCVLVYHSIQTNSGYAWFKPTSLSNKLFSHAIDEIHGGFKDPIVAVILTTNVHF